MLTGLPSRCHLPVIWTDDSLVTYTLRLTSIGNWKAIQSRHEEAFASLQHAWALARGTNTTVTSCHVYLSRVYDA